MGFWLWGQSPQKIFDICAESVEIPWSVESRSEGYIGGSIVCLQEEYMMGVWKQPQRKIFGICADISTNFMVC